MQLGASRVSQQCTSPVRQRFASPSRLKGKSAASPMEPGTRGKSRRMGPVTTSEVATWQDSSGERKARPEGRGEKDLG